MRKSILISLYYYSPSQAYVTSAKAKPINLQTKIMYLTQFLKQVSYY